MRAAPASTSSAVGLGGRVELAAQGAERPAADAGPADLDQALSTMVQVQARRRSSTLSRPTTATATGSIPPPAQNRQLSTDRPSWLV